MPYKKRPVRRKRRPSNYRNKYNPRPLQILKRKPSNMAPRIWNFKRTWASTDELRLDSPPAGWTSLSGTGDNALVLNYVIGLTTIPNYQNFQNLFDSWRIKGVRIKGFFSNTSSIINNKQSILYYIQNQLGAIPVTDLSEDFFNERPRSKKRVLLNNTGRPSFDIFMPATQLANTYQTTLNTDYALQKPRFISTTEPNTPHYTMSLRLQRIDNKAWTDESETQYPSLKLFTTVYFQMRGMNS